jgi:hypothetical protein
MPAGERTPEGFYAVRGGIDAAIARGLSYAPYADLVWFETGEPNYEEAAKFAAAIHEKFPGACGGIIKLTCLLLMQRQQCTKKSSWCHRHQAGLYTHYALHPSTYPPPACPPRRQAAGLQLQPLFQLEEAAER